MQQQWLKAHSETLSAKLHVIEKQLLARTYTGDTIPALQKIDDQLTKAQRRLDARDQQVQHMHSGTLPVSHSAKYPVQTTWSDFVHGEKCSIP